MKKQKIIVVTIISIIIIFLMYLTFNHFQKEPEHKDNNEIVDEIEGFNYQLTINQTSLFKDLFQDLSKLLANDDYEEEEYAKLIAQLFIIDFYDLNSKITKNDIGGLQFVLTAIKDNFELKAKDTIYHHVESNLYGARKQELPVVTRVNVITINPFSFVADDLTDDKAYLVNVEWEYQADLEYQNTAEITLVHEGSKLSIANVK